MSKPALRYIPLQYGDTVTRVKDGVVETWRIWEVEVHHEWHEAVIRVELVAQEDA